MERLLDELLSRPDIRLIGKLAADSNVEAFLVGGGLRDCLLGREVRDLDFVVSGAHRDLPCKFAAETGATFFWLDEGRLQARVVKRTGKKRLIYDFAPLQGSSLADDLVRRDFTINALALPVSSSTKRIFDPLQGGEDLRNGVIRACAASAFDEDPLRLLRAIRFAAELGFVPDDGTGELLCRKTELIGIVAAERVRDELFRILSAPGHGISLRKLWMTGLWQAIFPAGVLREGTAAAKGCDALHVDERAARSEAVDKVAERLASVNPELKRRLAAYLDREVEAGITVSSLIRLAAFLGADDGAAYSMVAERLRLGRNAGRMLQFLGRDERSLLGILEQYASERVKYRFFRDREPAGLAVSILARAAGDVSEQCGSQLAVYYLSRYEPQVPDLFLTGDEIMAMIGAGPGAVVGELMAGLREAESTGLVGTKEEAREYIKNLLTREGALR